MHCRGPAVSVSQLSATGSEAFCPLNKHPRRNDLPEPFSVSATLFLYFMFLRLRSPLGSSLLQLMMTSPWCRSYAEQCSPFPPLAGEERRLLLHRVPVPIPAAAPSSHAAGVSHHHPSEGAACRARAARQVPGERRSQRGRAGEVAAGLFTGRAGCSLLPHCPRSHTDDPGAGPGALFPWQRQALSAAGSQGPS